MSKSIAKYERFDNDGLELVINTKTGESFATISGYARMVGKSVDAIAKRVKRGSKGLDKTTLKKAEILTPGGKQRVDMINEDTIADWIVEDNPKLARAMLKAGVRVFMHSAAGYKVSSKAEPTQWQKLRQEGKKARLSLTDVVKQWIEDHPEMSANERKFIYINVSDALNVGLFGKKASKLREIIGCSKNDLRDHFSDAEIVAIHTIEDLAARLVMFEGLHPVRAVQKALETSHYRLGFYGSYKELTPAE